MLEPLAYLRFVTRRSSSPFNVLGGIIRRRRDLHDLEVVGVFDVLLRDFALIDQAVALAQHHLAEMDAHARGESGVRLRAEFEQLNRGLLNELDAVIRSGRVTAADAEALRIMVTRVIRSISP